MEARRGGWLHLFHCFHRPLFFCACAPLLLHLWLGATRAFDGFEARSVRGQRVLVTGASRGVGEALALKYAGLGAHLVLALARPGDRGRHALGRQPRRLQLRR